MIKQPILSTSATLFIFIMTPIIIFMLSLITLAIISSTHYKTSQYIPTHEELFNGTKKAMRGQRSSRDKERKQKNYLPY